MTCNKNNQPVDILPESHVTDEPCPACKDLGWVLCNTGNNHAPQCAIQRCDACEKFDNQATAIVAAVQAVQTLPDLLRFVHKVAEMRHEREIDERNPFERASEDYISDLNSLILEARQLLGTADKCSRCCEIVPYVIGCPNGAELCQDCFEAGQEGES
jgi:hypothetical protein